MEGGGTMDLEELLEMLELDEPQEFEYFENFSDLVESEEEMPVETLYDLFSQTDQDTIAELIDNYFDDTLDAVPDDQTDVYMLLGNIKRELTGLMSTADEEDQMRRFCEELYKFKQWYSFESEVACTDKETGREKELTVRDALTLARLEKLGHEEYDYDFSDCLEYDLDEYAMDLAGLAAEEEPESDDPLDNGFVLDRPDE
jgi:hypothetical protein